MHACFQARENKITRPFFTGQLHGCIFYLTCNGRKQEVKASLTDAILESFANELPDEFNRGRQASSSDLRQNLIVLF